MIGHNFNEKRGEHLSEFHPLALALMVLGDSWDPVLVVNETSTCIALILIHLCIELV